MIFIASSSDIIMMHWIGVDNIDGLSLTQCQVCTYVNWSYDSNAMLFYNISDPWSKDFRPLILSSDDGPIFDNSLVTNVTAQFGGTAHLPCKVHNIKYADNPVSTYRKFCWMHSDQLYDNLSIIYLNKTLKTFLFWIISPILNRALYYENRG